MKRTKSSVNENQQATWKPVASGVQSEVLSLIVAKIECLLKIHLYIILYIYPFDMHGYWWHLMSKALFFFSLKSSISFLLPSFILFFFVRRMMRSCEWKGWLRQSSCLMTAELYFNLYNGAHRGEGRDSQRNKWEISRKFYCLPLCC